MKKALIITYYWPPAGGPGVQRVLKFVKHLREFGWEPIILTVKKGEYPAFDETLIDDIPKNIKVYKTKSIEPFAIYKKIIRSKNNISTHVLNKVKGENISQKLMRWIRANIFLPDARIGWIPFIVKEGCKIVQEEKPDIIFSSSPPHSLQLGARKLAKKTGVKWVADFRDPWTDGFWQKDLKKTLISRWYDAFQEKRVLKSPDCITTVSNGFSELLMQKTKKRIEVITNGYDEKDFLKPHQLTNNDVFKIVHTGSMRKSQIPMKLFIALEDLVHNLKLTIRFDFYGTVHPDVLNIVNKMKLEETIIFHNYVSHDTVINNILSADLLIVPVPDVKDNKGIIPAKLFEFLRSGTFILGFGPKESEVVEIIRNTDSGLSVEFSTDMKHLLYKYYNEWKNGEFKLKNQKDIHLYSRRHLTKLLTENFDRVICE